MIIKIGKVEVKDVFDYMEGLAQYEAGDETKVVVRRGEEILELDVKF